MSKKTKKNRIQLIVVFVVLLLAVIAVQVNKSKKGERSFKAELLEFDTEEVVSISLQKQSGDQQSLRILLENEKWIIKANEKSYDADSDLIKNMINELADLKAVQKVAAKKDKWSDFEVTDSSGIRVIVNNDRRVIGDLYIGRFSYNQNTRKPKTFVRLNNEKDVFAVEGYLSMTFNRDLNGLRDKSIFRGNKNDFTRITVSYPADSSFTLIKEEAGWMINGVVADSVQTSNYLGSLAYLTATEFRDDLEPASLSGSPISIILEGNNMGSVEIRAIQGEDGRTAIVSNANPNSVFNGDTGDLFTKIFVGPGIFLTGLESD
ncbi:MAG: DUF4340 domain-containing protein [Bacteroidota bacterium]|nr:DUF4340 domain-containing protein [Bacteroidota bacterium]